MAATISPATDPLTNALAVPYNHKAAFSADKAFWRAAAASPANEPPAGDGVVEEGPANVADPPEAAGAAEVAEVIVIGALSKASVNEAHPPATDPTNPARYRGNEGNNEAA